MEHTENSNPDSKKRRYTWGEELMNALSHGLGAGFAVAGATLLIAASALQRDWYKLAASIIYGASLIVLYLMSTLYHAAGSDRVKKVLRVFDHCSIFLLIAGTYTPYTLVTLRNSVGWVLFGCIWAAALVGIVLNIVSIERFKIFSMVCYLGMGWSVLTTVRPLMAAIPAAGLWLLVWGGIAYTVGVVFYLIKNMRYFHGIWHLFVLGGSILHFFSIFLYVVL